MLCRPMSRSLSWYAVLPNARHAHSIPEFPCLPGMLVAKCPAASFVCCAAKCFRPPTRHAVPAKSAWPVMGFYHVKSLRHRALWKGSVVWAYGGRQSMARPRRHRPSPTACRGRSRSLMTVTERRVKEARREPTQGSTPPWPWSAMANGSWRGHFSAGRPGSPRQEAKRSPAQLPQAGGNPQTGPFSCHGHDRREGILVFHSCAGAEGGEWRGFSRKVVSA